MPIAFLREQDQMVPEVLPGQRNSDKEKKLIKWILFSFSVRYLLIESSSVQHCASSVVLYEIKKMFHRVVTEVTEEK